jgi:flagellar basal-body rod protein FlgC
MDLLNAIEVSASGLSAQRTRMDVASSNLANVSTTRTAEGGPYRRKSVVLSSEAPAFDLQAAGEGAPGAGVRVAGIEQDQSPPRLEYDPGHPDANAAGYVAYPNVNVVEEMVDMITASRAYEAGITALNTTVSMAERALTIGR